MTRYWTWLGQHYWTIWIAALTITFALREFPALARRRPQDTLSWYVWNHAQVIRHQPISQWSASHFLFAGTFLVLVAWLSGHFLLRWWT